MRKVIAAGAVLTGMGMMTEDFKSSAEVAIMTDDYLPPREPVPHTRVKDVPFYAYSLVSQEDPAIMEVQIELDDITYSVKKGDTLSQIAKEFGVPLKTIVEMNQIKNPNMISIDQEIIIPRKTETMMTRKPSVTQHVMHDLIENEDHTEHVVNHHIMKRFFDLENIIVQHQEEPPPTLHTMDFKMDEEQTVKRSSVTVASVKVEEDIPTFSWPVKDFKITSKFGMRWGRHHNGIDIVSADKNSDIYAAKSGTVVTALFSKGGLGNLIVIDHGNGVETYYGHLSKLHVFEGDQVRAGDVIGEMGNTGRSTGVHLHFEIRKDDNPVNPLDYLTKGL